MNAPSFKPIYDVIRIKKKETNSDIDTDLYKEFLDVRKKTHIDLENKNVKIIIYEHVEREGRKDLNISGSSESSSSSSETHIQAKKTEAEAQNRTGKKGTHGGESSRGKKTGSRDRETEPAMERETTRDGTACKAKGGASIAAKTTSQNENSTGPSGKKEDMHKEDGKKQADSRNEHEENISECAEKGKKKDREIVVKNKSTKMLGTVKILYNFYVNLFDKIKEDVENIKNNTSNNNVDLFKDMNLYTNYISMFDIINLCEDLKIIKTFLNSKKECELIWILTVNHFDKINENLFERYKYKIDVTCKKKNENDQDIPNEKGGNNKIDHTGEHNGEENGHDSGKPCDGQKYENKSELSGEVSQTGGRHEAMKTAKKSEKKAAKGAPKNLRTGASPDTSTDVHTDEKRAEEWTESRERSDFGKREESALGDNEISEGNWNVKDYIYENCSEKKNAIMFRKVNFFIFVYVLIYIIKTSTRKIKAITDDIKKVRSFFFFLNLYEKKKTIETLTNIYKDKYLNFYQNYNGSNEIEDHRKRKIFRHKFSFHNVNKILNSKDDLVRLKNTGKKNIDTSSVFSDAEKKKIDDGKNISQNETLTLDNTIRGSAAPNEKSKDVNKRKEDLCNYEVTNLMATSELTSDFQIMNKSGDEQKKKKNVLLNQYIFDYIFKNYCYKKKYWGLKEGTCIDFGLIKDENKKYKIDIYNHSKYNISVDVDIDNELPVLGIFKNKLFCVSSKYTIYLEIDKTKVGEKLGFVNVKLKYKNVSKQDDVIKIPVYIFIHQ
ncbi:conserved Plasmodium protein, unknown function [Plasmodium ovale wallikeri]|uniref:Uncharacterized protein n=2 Tax=Plasmodium ovale TaxID=36330 RepID=A0A1A8YLH3_PLAOA|nr:conserved Plasmodium protein, unknown function [Plasmodium ovale wallikeri]SBT33009.1 conserved Plasmodium protein, unknown function [Plasmodium ovale wallikeri]SBT75949.1 conserved Plasmodium protein, unknown function [Plasmodium ovale]